MKYYRRSKDYALELIDNTFFLLCFGNKHASLAKEFKLDEVGAIIWNKILTNSYISESDLLNNATTRFAENNYYFTELEKQTVVAFLNNLIAYGAVDCFDIIFEQQINDYRVYNIADIALTLFSEQSLIDGKMNQFLLNEETDTYNNKKHCEMHISCKNDELDLDEVSDVSILSSENVDIYDIADLYLCVHKTNYYVSESVISKNGEQSWIFYKMTDDISRLKDELFQTERFLFFYIAQLNGKIALHSSSVLYNEKLWLFSAHSGVGKSTHAQYWEDCFDVEQINGDSIIVGMENEIPIAYGIPWCGTSDISKAGRWRLGGIVFLKQGQENELIQLDISDATVKLINRIISPFWTRIEYVTNVRIAESLCNSVDILYLECKKDYSAARFCKEKIDYIDSK